MVKSVANAPNTGTLSFLTTSSKTTSAVNTASTTSGVTQSTSSLAPSISTETDVITKTVEKPSPNTVATSKQGTTSATRTSETEESTFTSTDPTILTLTAATPTIALADQFPTTTLSTSTQQQHVPVHSTPQSIAGKPSTTSGLSPSTDMVAAICTKSTGALAGAILGAFFGYTLILALIACYLVRKYRSKLDAPPVPPKDRNYPYQFWSFRPRLLAEIRTRKRQRQAQSEVLDISRSDVSRAAERGSASTLVRFEDTLATWIEKRTDDGLEHEQTPTSRTNQFTSSSNMTSSGLESSFPLSSTVATVSPWGGRRPIKYPNSHMHSPSRPPSIPSEVLATRGTRERVTSMSPSTETLV